MSGFQTVCRVSDLGEGDGLTVEVAGRLVAVFCSQGRYYAIDDVCPHMGASLAGGHVEGGVVTCPWHAWRFRLADGAWADYPKVKIGCYPVRVVGEEIQVEVAGGGPGGPPAED
jgi:nitrite reductase (NADH) small subunit/3-phenylpropionate/trans-cinnamate dioxygenase ferredoxin subunit